MIRWLKLPIEAVARVSPSTAIVVGAVGTLTAHRRSSAGVRPADVEELLGWPHRTVMRALGQAVEEGLVDVAASPVDRRVRLYSIGDDDGGAEVGEEPEDHAECGTELRAGSGTVLTKSGMKIGGPTVYGVKTPTECRGARPRNPHQLPARSTPDTDRETFVRRWLETWSEHRSGQAPTGLAGAGECIGWLVAESERIGVPFEGLLEAKLGAYWAAEWPRAHRSNPTPANLLRFLPGLAGEVGGSSTESEQLRDRIRELTRTLDHERDLDRRDLIRAQLESTRADLARLRRESAA